MEAPHDTAAATVAVAAAAATESEPEPSLLLAVLLLPFLSLSYIKYYDIIAHYPYYLMCPSYVSCYIFLL